MILKVTVQQLLNFSKSWKTACVSFDVVTDKSMCMWAVIETVVSRLRRFLHRHKVYLFFCPCLIFESYKFITKLARWSSSYDIGLTTHGCRFDSQP